MTLASKITKAPIPFDAERGREAAALFAGAPKDFQALIAGTAGCSDYLFASIMREQVWLQSVLDAPPEAAFEALLSDISGATQGALGQSLRQAKRRAALLIALADLGGIWSLGQVTGALSELADRAVEVGLEHLVRVEQERGKLPTNEAPCGGLIALAMGKMGAGELNYSSDIDLIMLFDESLYPPQDYADIRNIFIRVTQRLVRLLSEVTAEGYVFRTDLRLRPDPSVTPVCIGMDAAARYYEAYGRTWERAAMIKARPCAGDLVAGGQFLAELSPFIWRRHLDFAAIQDAHDMRERIRTHKGLGGALKIPGHDVKLGRGGIREIEFFVQTRQLICGGRDKSLRGRETLAMLGALNDKGWVDKPTRETLHEDYLAHRTLEHRLQMLGDAQTHDIPTEKAARERLAAFCGQSDLAAFEAGLVTRFERVHQLTEGFFAPDVTPAPSTPATDIWAGFARPEVARETAERWQSLPALRHDRARKIFYRLEPQLAERLEAALSPDEALAQFDQFLRGLPAGVQVFSMFDANPQLLDLLIDICATAPRLAGYLGRNAAVLDAVLAQEFFAPLPARDVLQAELMARLAAARDYEAVLDEARAWVKEYRFRGGVHLLRGISTTGEAARGFSDLADVVLAALYPQVVKQFAARHGSPPGLGAAIVAMGKLGSRDMTATSDMDLIVIYDAAGVERSDGARSLPVSTYYARLTQALVAAVSAPTATGTLYQVDMRLRPSGRRGPVAVSLEGFRGYQTREAWTWEHLALTRARVVAGVEEVGAAVEAEFAQVIGLKRDRATLMTDTREMRARLAEANATANDDPWEIKLGRGRLLDIELCLQAGMLAHADHSARRPVEMIGKLLAHGWLKSKDAETLGAALALYANIQQLGRVAIEGGFSPEHSGRGLRKIMLRVTGAGSLEALTERLTKLAAQSARIVARLLEYPDKAV